MSSDPQHSLKKTLGRESPSPRPRSQPKKSPPGAMETSNGPKPPAKCQVRKPVAQSSTNPAAASSDKPDSVASPSQKKKHVILTHRAPSANASILWEELEENYPKAQWFDSYDSLDKVLLQKYGKGKRTEKVRLANLPILVQVKDGIEHWVGLQAAVRDAISYLLDVEATWNPVTAITNRPQGSSKPLWTGKLWLGGIRDSGNEKLLSKDACDISAVVSIHPEDWLTEESWKGLFQQWDGKTNSLQLGLKQSVRMQYLIKLKDDSTSDLAAYFQTAFRFMDYYLLQGKNVLVHCKMGQSRSASLVLGYMMHRYYKVHLEDLSLDKAETSDKRLSDQKRSKDLEILKTKLKEFTEEISMPLDEPNRIARRTARGKRRGISTKKFQEQLCQYLGQLAKVNSDKKDPMKQPNPTEKKAGGGIIRDAILVLCFMHNMRPTREILGYWSSRKDTNKHYWIAASKDKSRQEGIDVKDHLASFNEFFEPYFRKHAGSSA